MRTLVQAVLTGAINPDFSPDGEASAIAKAVVEDGPRTVHRLGIEGDEQADLNVHGGRDKAIHHYPRDHYLRWRLELGPHPLLDQAGAFGENISTLGWKEEALCIGDRIRMGTALVEVAQGRQPCWKQGHRFGSNKVVAAMVASGRTGWYYRVIEEGSVAAGDVLELVGRVHPEWSVARVFGLLIGGQHKGEKAALKELSRLRELADGWRERATKLAG
ncbi:MAG: MOSC domain-containing protein [Sphingomicrobium sp.]